MNYYDKLFRQLGDVNAVEATLYSAPHQKRRRAQLVTEFDLLCQPDMTALDLGCGGGWYTAELAKRCKEVVGVEVVDWLIEQAPQAENISYLTIDWNELTFEPEKFNLILATEVLEHEPQYTALAARLWTWTKPGGVLLATVPVSETRLPDSMAFDLGGIVNPRAAGHGSGHVWLPQPNEFIHFLQEIGWNVEKQVSDGVFIMAVGRKI